MRESKGSRRRRHGRITGRAAWPLLLLLGFTAAILWLASHPRSDGDPARQTAAVPDPSAPLTGPDLSAVLQKLPPRDLLKPFQRETARPEGSVTAQVRQRLTEVLAQWRDGGNPGAAPAMKPLVPPPAVDPALLPKPAQLTKEQIAGLANLRWRSGKQLDYRAFNAHGTLNYLSGMMLEPPAEMVPPGQSPPEATARRFLTRNKQLLLLEDPSEELVLTSEEQDTLGYTQLRFRQAYQGLEVWPADVAVTVKPGGHVSLFTGSYIPTPLDVPRRPQIDGAAAGNAARRIEGLENGRLAGPPQLIVYAPREEAARLAYKVDAFGNLAEHWTVVVDAADGDVLTHFSHLCTAAVEGSGTDLKGAAQSLPLWQHNDGFYYLVDTTRPMYQTASSPPALRDSRGVIKIVDAGDREPQGADVTYVDVRSQSATSGFSPEAVSASVNLGRVYTYLRERFGRNSIDGQGGSILGVVNVKMNNAFWNGSFIALGNGDTWAGSLDFNGHEMSHGVISETSKLVYQNQSGALNEAFADILGEGCEAHFAEGNLDWILGSGLSTGLRSMKDPKSIPLVPGFFDVSYPSRMSEFLTNTHPDTRVANLIERDRGGVHFNSSIINHAFYLLTEGLPGAIGLDDSLQIFYRTVTTKLHQQSNFIDCRIGCMASARELFGEGSVQMQKVSEAFDAVEIYDQRPPSAPAPIPTVDGQDNTLFTFTPDFNTQYLGRLELAQGDGQVGIQLSGATVRANSSPSVSGDGSLAVFVDATSDIVLVNTLTGEGEKLGFDGQVSSASMSADGSTYGFVFLDEFGNPTETLSIINVATDESVDYDLTAPIFDQTGEHSGSPVLFADVIDFTPDGRFIYYDALNRVPLESGYSVDLWSIYYLDQSTGNTYIVIPPIPGANIGNPALGQAHNHFLVFEAELEDGANYIFAADLDRGEIGSFGAIAEGAATPFIARPSYSGDDTAIVYTEYSFDPLIGWIPRVDHLPVQPNGIEAAGEADIWLNTAVVGMPTVRGVIYRRGQYQGLPEIHVTGGPVSGEGQGSAGRFTLTRTGQTTTDLNVAFVLTGQAANGVDFQETPLTVDIPAGSDTAEIVLTWIDDLLVEGSEDVILTLEDRSHYVRGTVTASITVTDNDNSGGEPFGQWAEENGLQPQDLLGNADSDPLVHLIEYALGLDPNKNDGGGSIDTELVRENGESYLTLVVRRSRRAADLDYIVEVSSSLQAGQWSSGTEETVVLEDSATILRVRDKRPLTANDVRAMRLRIRTR